MQPRFRTLKTTIRTRLQEPGWDDFAKELDEVPARELVGPLFSCLPLGGEATDRAASALGKAVSRMADEHIEEARNVVRRLMWHMNEESGNIGWRHSKPLPRYSPSTAALDEFHPSQFLRH
ncbi:MAG: DVU0298 family protein [Bilophila wadsworthia]